MVCEFMTLLLYNFIISDIFKLASSDNTLIAVIAATYQPTTATSVLKPELNDLILSVHNSCSLNKCVVT